MQKQRPVFLDLPSLRLPIPGIVSILHRVSGVGIFVCLPFLLYLFAGTLNHEQGFQTYQVIVANPIVKLLLIGLLWAYMHHFFAGLRFLALDIHKGLDLETARMTAKVVAVLAVVATAVLGVVLW